MVIVAAAALASAQAISVRVEVVNVNVVVKDADNRPVAGLDKADFSLEEDGRQQKVRYFSRESDLPLTLGLLVDVSGSMTEHLPQVQEASAEFVGRMLKEGDEAFLVRFENEVMVVQRRTGSAPKMQSALRLLGPRGNVRLDNARRCPGFAGIPRFSGTPLYDAIVEGTEQLPRSGGRRRALIVLTDGMDHNSCASLDRAIESALKAEATVYVIFYTLPAFGHEELRYQAREAMNKIAFLTGGDLYEATEAPAAAIYATIEQELRQMYSLGYSSDKPAGTPEYRRIRVSVQKPGTKVAARFGYYAKPHKK